MNFASHVPQDASGFESGDPNLLQGLFGDHGVHLKTQYERIIRKVKETSQGLPPEPSKIVHESSVDVSKIFCMGPLLCMEWLDLTDGFWKCLSHSGEGASSELGTT